MQRTFIKTFSQKEYCWLIPGSIDLPNMLKRYPPPFKPKLDFFYHILDTICRTLDYLGPADDTIWVRLNAQRLQRFNRKYHFYINYLKERGVLRISKYYTPGVESRGYRISYTYLVDDPVEIPVSAAFRKRVKALREAEMKACMKNTSGHQHLTKWFNEKLTIDGKRARAEVERLYPTFGNHPTVKGRILRDARDGKFKALRAIKKLEKGDFSYRVDDTIGRFHSVLTNTKKELRNYLTYDRQTLVNLDLKNAQPLFSGVLLNPDFYDPEASFSLFSLKSPLSLLNISPTKLKALLREINFYIMLVESPECHVQQEFERFLQLVQQGRFYHELFNIINPGQLFTEEKKNTIKKMVFTLMFSDNRKKQSKRRQEKPFKLAFPTIHKIFSALKRHNKCVLSNILQRTESFIIIETVTRKIAQERPDLPIFTVHDSIATTAGNEDYVSSVMREEIERITGLTAAIGKEFWTPPVQTDLTLAEKESLSSTSQRIAGSASSGKAA